MTEELRFCKNCFAELHGEFCSSCGQRDKEVHVPVKDLATELMENIPAFDERLFRSMKLFITKPGVLTLEYLSGKRKKYLSPFKFYFFISLLFFFVNSFNISETKKNLRNDFLQSDSLTSVMNGDSSSVSIRSGSSGISFTIADTVRMQKLFGKSFIDGFKSGQNNPQLFFDKIREHLPKIVFLLLPVFALLLKLVYVRSNILYVQHLIFSFYFHSFIFLILLIDTLLEMTLPKGMQFYSNVLFLAIPVYLFIGLNNVYQQTRWKTTVKLLLLLLSHFFVFMMTVSLFVVATILLFFT